MGTTVQYNMNVPGYYSVTGLYDGTTNNIWASHHENKSFRQYYGIFPSRPSADEYIGHDREKLRETILRHETVFRHQLHELHRLHHKQANMMNEVRGKETYKQPNLMLTSPPSCFYASPPDDNERGWCDSSQPFLGAHSVPSHYKLMNVDTVRSSYGSTHNSSKFKDHASLESKCQKVQRRFVDLELPGDNYVSDEEQKAAVGGLVKGTSNRSFQVPCKRSGNLFTQSGMYSSDALSSNMLLQRKTCGFTDLNEPTKVEVASSSASVDILEDVTWCEEEIGRRESTNSCSGLQYKGKEISHSPYKENCKCVGQCNRHLEGERGQRECLPYASSAGQSISNRCSLGGSFHSEYLRMGTESSQAGYKEVHRHDQNKAGKSTKKIFGVEMSERKPGISVMTSDSLPHPFQLQSLGQAPSLLPKNLPSNTVLQLNKHPGIKNIVSHCDAHVTLLPNSGAEVLYNDSLGYVSQVDSKESRNGQALVGFGCLDGNSNSNSAPDRVTQHITTNNLGSRSWLVDLNCTEVNVDSVPNKCHRKDIAPDFSLMSNAMPSGNSALKPCSEISGVNSIKVNMLLPDLNQDPLTSESGERLGTESLKPEKGSVDTSDHLRNHIDLNVSTTEEDMQEAPAVFEPEDVISGDECFGGKFKEASLIVNDESRKVFPEGAMMVAAEALVTISSSNSIDSQDNATCNELESSAHDALQWFAEKISSYTCYIENDASPVCAVKNSSVSEDSAPEEIDFFEYMSLNLAETKVEVSNDKLTVLENSNNDIQQERRPQRGRAKKRKDFQRDVLPSIISLCKNDVIEDLQILEGLVRESGGTWQSSLSERDSPKNRGRGRKRAAAKSAATSPTLLTSVSPPQEQQQQPNNCNEPGLEETTRVAVAVAGWGKRTRRPSRLKHPADQPVMVH